MANNKSMKSVIGSFIEAYAQRDKETDFSVWLADRLRQELPDLPEGAERTLVQDIVTAVADYDKTLSGLNEAVDSGMSKEEWFAEQMVEGGADLEYDEAGEKLSQVEQELTVSGMRLMQEMDKTGQYEEEEGADSVEWNQYSIKHKLYEIGKKVCLAGLAVSANALRHWEEADGELTIGDAVKEALREDMATNPQEVKAVVAGAVKVAAEKRLVAALPLGTAIEVISDMAGAAVESARTLFDAANGEIGGLEAVDGIGRATVASACRIGKTVLQGKLMSVPLAGPLLVDMLGGLLEHMESRQFHENVYQVFHDVYRIFHDAAVATWEGITGCETVQKATNMNNFVFG